MKYIAALILLTISCGAQAQSYFVCDCQTGAEGSCVAGSSGNNGTSAATPKQTWAQLPDINTRAAGTTVSFCKGGSFAWSLVRLENPNGTKANPITLTSYDPAWGGTAKPLLFTNPAGTDHGSASAFEFGGFFDEVDDAGYVFRGLHLKGPGINGMSGSTRGFLIWGVLSAVIFEDLEVEGFLFGWEMTNGTDGGDPQTGTGVIIRNSWVHHNSMGVLGSRQDLTIEGNLFEYNNDGCTSCGFSHALYIGTGRSFSGDHSRRTAIRGNTIRNNSLNASGNCDGGSLTMHGRFDQILIEENLIETTTGTPTTSCYGISMNEGYGPEVERIQRLVVRGNTVANVGNVCIESNIGSGAAVYENNRCIKTRSGGNAPNIAVSLTGEAASLGAGTNANNTIIRNNTCYVTVAASGSCISVGAGTGHTVINNLAILGPSATADCWAPSAIGNFAVWDHNHCHEQGSGQWSSSYASLAAAQAAGYDTNGSAAAVSFATTPASPTWDMSLSSNVTGRSTGKPPRDSLYCQRATNPTRGAVEFGPSGCTSIRSPVNF